MNLLINITFNKFPAKTAEAIYVRELSKAFTEKIKKNFLLIIGNDNSDELVNVPHFTIGFRKRRFRTFYYFFWIPFFFLFKIKNKKDTVFFSNDQFLLSSLIIWKKLFGFSYKVCADWHMFSNTWKDRFIARNAHKHITTTEHLRKQIIEILGGEGDRILTVYGGVNDSFLSFSQNIKKTAIRSKLGLPLEQILVGYVGLFRTLGMEKGIDTMIKSLKYLSKDKNIKMVFVGGKNDEIDFYKRFAKKQGVLNKCIFIEKVSSEHVFLYESILDLLVIPYPNKPHYRNYGFPMKVYEYMASGVPIVYSNLPIIDEVLSGFGVSFVAEDEKSLAGVINRLAKDKESATRLVNLAKEKVKEYTWSKKAEKIIKFISQ